MENKVVILKSCFDLTMDKFIDCLVDGKLSVLGEGTDVELSNAWQSILFEFSELRQESTINESLELQKEIAVLENKVNIIDLCVSVLWEVYNRDLANELKSLGYILKLDWSNKVEYYGELKKVISKRKTLIVQLDSKKKKLVELVEKAKGKGYKRNDFVKINTNLSQFMKFRVDNKNTTVAEWCDMVSKYESYLEVRNAERNNLLKDNSRWV